MSPSKTLYVRDEDVSIWERAEKAAKATRQSVSTIVATALQAYLSTTETTEATTRQPTHVPRYPNVIQVVPREMALNPGIHDDFDITKGPILEWTKDGWRLRFLLADGEQDDYLFPERNWSTDKAITAAARHLDAIYQYTGRIGEIVLNDIVVNMWDAAGRVWIEGFRGRWLIEPADDNRGTIDAGACYGIALTVKGKIAVYAYHVNDKWPPVLEVFDSLDEAAAEVQGMPDELIASAAAEMGQRRIVWIWRDI